VSAIARALLAKLLAQADRAGRATLPITERSARDYFAVRHLAGRDAIHADLANAQAAGAVTLEWGRGAGSQDLQRIRIQDPDRLAAWLGVSRSEERALAIDRQLAPLMEDAPDWLRDAYREALERWRRGASAFHIAAAQPDTATALFRVARAVAAGEQTGLDLRRFSVRVLGDSKAVEGLLGRLAGLLRRNPAWSIWEQDPELLCALGLEKFPPPVFVKGPLALDYGGVPWDLTGLRPYVALSPDAIGKIRNTAPVPYLLTVENLASFQRHVREISDSGVAVYTAGFPAPALADFLARLDRSLPPDCPFYHWGDRDLGGLRIYDKVAAACAGRQVQPHLMGIPCAMPTGIPAEARRALGQAVERGGAAGGLARRWLAADLGWLEQEGVDPASPLD
jgi:hypothetical protein